MPYPASGYLGARSRSGTTHVRLNNRQMNQLMNKWKQPKIYSCCCCCCSV